MSYRAARSTISSLGGIGGTAFTPIINAPEVAILGLSRSRMTPVWDGAKFEPRLLLPLDLSWDHRVVDGAQAAASSHTSPASSATCDDCCCSHNQPETSNMKTLVVASLSLAFIGCGVTPHEISVDLADRSTYSSSAVVGIPVHVTVSDDRDSGLVGQRSVIGAKITGTNLPRRLKVAVKELFQAKDTSWSLNPKLPLSSR